MRRFLALTTLAAAAVLGGCLVWFFTPNPNQEDAGEWKSTGDGKTIVNSKTGELRLTRTGESVEFAEEMRLREIELNKIIAEKNAHNTVPISLFVASPVVLGGSFRLTAI